MRIDLRVSIFLSILLLLLTACTGSTQFATPEERPLPATPTPPPKLILLSNDSNYPAGCSAAEVGNLLLRFAAAYNRGDLTELSGFFAPTFEWYSDDLRLNFTDSDKEKTIVTSERDELLGYFARRHQQNDMLQLQAVRIVGKTWHGGIDIVFLFNRQADDLEGSELVADGKGAVRCPQQKIFVWSFGNPKPYRESVKPCSEFQADVPQQATLVC